MGAARVCPEIEWNGKQWKIGFPTESCRKEIERLIVAQASGEIMALKGIVPDAEFEAHMAGFRESLIAGEYKAPLGRCFKKAFDNDMVLVFLAMVRQKHPEATKTDAIGIMRDCKEAAKLAIVQVMPDFFAVLLAVPEIPADQQKVLLELAIATFKTANENTANS